MIEGGCRCGAARYRIDGDALPRCYACHCHVCQRATGSAFAVQALIAEDALHVEGPVVVHEQPGVGRVSVQRFCSTCHSRLYNTSSAHPGLAVVRAGTLDRSEEVRVRAHIFTAYRQGWVVLGDDVPAWPEAAPPDAFAAAMRADA